MASYEVFKKCIAFVLMEEGGYSNDKRDLGGETNHGISDRRDGIADGMADVDGDGAPDVKIKELDVKQASNIYWRDYWLKARCDRLPAAIAAFVFDASVNCGTKRASMFLQEALELPVDGKTGPITISGAELSNYSEMIERMAAIREKFYRSRESFPTFGNGWLNRNNRCKAFAKEFL